MSEGCCWYIVLDSPSSCHLKPDDIVTGPCEGECVDREVVEPGPCQGTFLSALAQECMACESSAATATLAAAARQRSVTAEDRAKAKPITAAQAALLRRVERP